MTTPNKALGNRPTATNSQEVSQFHRLADSDAGPSAIHHTLGPRSTQSSPGDHIHDGKSSKFIAALGGFVTRIGDIFTGQVGIITDTAQAFYIRGGFNRSTYMGFYPNTSGADPEIQRGRVGYFTNASPVFSIENPISSVNIVATALTVNGASIAAATHEHDITYVNETDHTKATHLALGLADNTALADIETLYWMGT